MTVQPVVVEADGVQYHVPALDKKREIEILAEFGIETMRFGGSQIWRAADECVAQIRRRLQKLDLTRPEYAHEDIADLDVALR